MKKRIISVTLSICLSITMVTGVGAVEYYGESEFEEEIPEFESEVEDVEVESEEEIIEDCEEPVYEEEDDSEEEIVEEYEDVSEEDDFIEEEVDESEISEDEEETIPDDSIENEDGNPSSTLRCIFLQDAYGQYTDVDWSKYSSENSDYTYSEFESLDGAMAAHVYQNPETKEYECVIIDGEFKKVDTEFKKSESVTEKREKKENSLYDRFVEASEEEGNDDEEELSLIATILTTAKYVWFNPGDASSSNTYAYLFDKFASAEIIRLTGKLTVNITDMEGMYNGCENAEVLLTDSDFNTSNVKSMRGMFANCKKLKYLNNVSWPSVLQTGSVTDMSHMFAGCSSFANALDLYDENCYFFTGLVTDMSYMFYGCEKLDFSTECFKSFYTGNVENMESMFEGCSTETEFDIRNFDLSKVTNMHAMFKGCSKLTSVLHKDFLEWEDTSAVTDMSAMFQDCVALVGTFYLINTDSVTDMSEMYSGCTSLYSATFVSDTSNVTDFSGLLDGCTGLTSVTFDDDFNTEKATDMSRMFAGCSKLETVDLSLFDTLGVNDMSSMFEGCSLITTLDLKNFDTSQTVHMEDAFKDTALTYIKCPKLSGNASSILPTPLYEKENGVLYEEMPKNDYDAENIIELVDTCNKTINLDSMGATMNTKVTSIKLTNGLFIGLPTLGDMNKSYSLAWYTKKAGGVRINEGDKYDGSYDTLYAQWVLRTLTISFETFGGSTMKDEYSYGGYTVIQCPEKIPYKKGYIFENWYSDEECTKQWMFSDDVVKDNMTLYAKWIPATYSVKYVGGGNVSGTMEKRTGCTTDQPFILDLNAFEKEGYTFAGWNTRADGEGKEFADGQEVSNLTTENEGTVTLYAMWKKADTQYSITYELGGGTNNSQNPAYYTYDGRTQELKVPVKKGYVFAGWYSDDEYTQEINYIIRGSRGDVQLYARWVPSKYTNTLNYDANGGSGAPASQNAKVTYPDTQKTFTLSTNKPTRKGYTFSGWYTQKTGGMKVGKTFEVGSKEKDANQTVTVYAHWNKDTYSVTYKLNGGKNSSKNPASYTVTTGDITLQNPTRTGYTFKGWYTDSKLTKKITVIKKGSTGNKTLYAEWTANKYTVKYNANGGSGSMKNQSMTYDKSAMLTKNSFTRKNYTFLGWSTDKKATKAKYKNQAEVKNLSSKSGGTVTLYAVWKKK